MIDILFFSGTSRAAGWRRSGRAGRGVRHHQKQHRLVQLLGQTHRRQQRERVPPKHTTRKRHQDRLRSTRPRLRVSRASHTRAGGRRGTGEVDQWHRLPDHGKWVVAKLCLSSYVSHESQAIPSVVDSKCSRATICRHIRELKQTKTATATSGTRKRLFPYFWRPCNSAYSYLGSNFFRFCQSSIASSSLTTEERLW